ncbi:MAG: NUDIX hydrolase [Sphaerobacter thermophilus]|uniref:GDP-mannose pyrophosphatase n=1 Tax=Sphaerobacter thermophilus (strain ATCC 49802 / DSM 20745 / KCCM 41009 / NCIMB 13125 / S 6022) TaxID=479434 RepID=D1C929_SPHTD|nr:NUDIX hydrolase [Sphaerobacter thermophilus]ACZ40322.1 NUDIX hydrolase [Sphaerobacter thermophilus DSM 20745]PZN61115.1 MAG: NUDIX hydrolase [Sphaerobacter thermophilus]
MTETTDKPVARGLGWRTVATRRPFTTPWIRLRQDDIAIGDEQITYTYLDQPPGVFVVPVTGDRRVVLIRQYRYPVDAWCLEVPAGGTHDRPGVPLADLAREELLEEVGGTCATIERIGSFHPSVTHSAQECHVFLALGVELGHTPRHEATERIEILPVPVGEALHLARTGRIADGQSALALLLCEERLRQRGYLD